MTPLEQEVLLNLLEPFLDSSLILEVLEVVRGGKEATVFRCRAAPSTGQKFFAAKVYRPMERRNFRNDSVYQAGRVILSSRGRRAYQNRSDFGREVQQGLWVAAEFETQRALHEAGADVPRPWKCIGGVILMEWLGADVPAPQLRHAKPPRDEAHAMHRTLLANIELMLRHNVIHADLSPFNVLYLGEGRVKIIDFPQAVDPRMSPNAMMLLHRDVENVCRFFERFGVESNPHRIASDLWRRFVLAEL
jgi:RIO kinase 1